MTAADYALLSKLFDQVHAVTAVAEAHGALAGALCSGADYAIDDWIAEIQPSLAIDNKLALWLDKIYSGTRNALEGQELALQLLLPADDMPIESRAEALGLWCQGFLYGLGTHGLRDAADMPGEVGEVVRDLTEITHIGVDASEGEERNETAFVELVEFVRVGVQLIFEELADRRRPGNVERPVLH
ncbi:MAG: UPF0149 family protein [Steroidobacteraceae bacterium]